MNKKQEREKRLNFLERFAWIVTGCSLVIGWYNHSKLAIIPMILALVFLQVYANRNYLD